MITIESTSGRFRACLDETDDGIAVALWRRDTNGPWRPLHRDMIEAPLHVVSDKIAAIINQLQPEVSAWPTRTRVLSINGVAR